MLIEFRVSNFRSFRDEQGLTMVASSDQSLTGNTFAPEGFGKKRLLKSAVIYGANASGKSNLIKAFQFFREFVVSSHEEKADNGINTFPFRLDPKTETSPTELEVVFIYEGVRYQYGFCVDKNRVNSEWLIAYPKAQPQKWFDRGWNEDDKKYIWHFGSQLKGEKERLIPVTRPNALFLSVGTQFNNAQLAKVYEWFNNHLTIVVNTDTAMEMFQEKQSISNLKRNPKFHKLAKNLLQAADVGINDFYIESKPVALSLDGAPDDIRKALSSLSEYIEENKPEGFQVKLSHPLVSKEESVIFPFEDESTGTRRLLTFSSIWGGALADGDTLIIDELDASLHPHLVRLLVELFHNSKTNKNNAQLIFNTHDTTLLDVSLFRRDQIWFTEKDTEGASHLYPLSDYSPRKDESLQRGYLKGRYGAVPFINELLIGADIDGETQSA